MGLRKKSTLSYTSVYLLPAMNEIFDHMYFVGPFIKGEREEGGGYLRWRSSRVHSGPSDEAKSDVSSKSTSAFFFPSCLFPLPTLESRTNTETHLSPRS